MIVFGRNVAKEILSSDKEVYNVYISNSFEEKEILDMISRKKIKVSKLDRRAMDNKFGNNNQGIALEIEDYKFKKIEDIKDMKFIIMLDHLEDPHNLGAIIRTSECAGVDAIIIPKKRSVQINSTVMKVSAGALNNVDIIEVSSLAQTIDKIKEYGYWVYGTDMEDSVNYTDVKYDRKTCLIIGSEGNGISRLVREKCDFIIRIPMKGKINSLNASVAAGIAIYEVVRQNNEE
ncbi:MAG: 23S rRNA (guanosine(2251)-2'-O)-methyltransferase RlmB [Bacilli bacterium]|nr:23S rRNA (guanosine(2251)-2'-O)-methyltransferase RlmB [Bacilli bacterium]